MTKMKSSQINSCKSKRALFRLVKRIQRHADEKRGMSNILLHSLAITATHSDIFRPISTQSLPYVGTFSADAVPTAKLAKKKSFSVVINLQRRKDIQTQTESGHFAAIAAFSTFTLFIDPFGLPCLQEDVRAFLKKRGLPCFYNEKQIQPYDSVFCGLFCLLFVLYFHRCPRWNLKFNKGENVKSNEKLCLKFLNKLLVM